MFAAVAFGLALLTREILFSFPLFFPLCLWWARVSWRDAGRYLLVLSIVILITLSPWLLRNYRTFGYAFYTERIEAVRYKLTGHGYLSPHYAHLDGEDNASTPQAPLSETVKRDIERFGQQSQWFSVEFLIQHPGTYFRHLINRFVEYWLHPNGLHSLPELFLVRALYVAIHVCMLALAVVGMVIGLRHRDIASGVFVAVLINITITNLFFSGPNPRYNLPFLPIVFIFTARGALVLYKCFALRTPSAT
jgi:4-amino-4-deoxy-L-arabinose transferase-like glycosyltransferase